MGGGLILAIWYFGIFEPRSRGDGADSLDSSFRKPYFQLRNLDIEVENETYPMLDTLKIDFSYQGSSILIRKDFTLLDYEFFDRSNLIEFLDEGFLMEPELEVIETTLPH